MRQTLEKLIQLETAVAQEKGPFDIFALFSTDEEAEDRWDLVVSATWIGEESLQALEYLTNKLHSYLTPEEFSRILKIAPLDVYDPRVKDIQKIVTTEHEVKELRDYRFHGLRVDRVYVLTCKLQIDERLMRLMWAIIVKLWQSGNEKIESAAILKELRERGETVRDYAMDRILEHLLNAGCIRGRQYINSDDVRQHGAMIITRVNADCRIISAPSSKRRRRVSATRAQ
ncbi:MAG TPA: hypothetical protein VNS63_08980 [Blastocatellia bacterium]|nr:hypothetical protein [Blastocatellia bacterium]